jgi:hypothetical protein
MKAFRNALPIVKPYRSQLLTKFFVKDVKKRMQSIEQASLNVTISDLHFGVPNLTVTG